MEGPGHDQLMDVWAAMRMHELAEFLTGPESTPLRSV